MPLTDVISHFSTASTDGSPGGYAVTRTAQGTFNAQGVFVPGATSQIGPMDACVVPMSSNFQNGANRIALPEGVHVQDVRVIDTTLQLRVEPPDVITIAGEPFAVFAIETVNFGGGTRYTAYAARQVIP